MTRIIPVLALLLAGCSVAAQGPESVRLVAITIDDGPVVNEPADLERFQRITDGPIGAFETERVRSRFSSTKRNSTCPGSAMPAAPCSWLSRSATALGRHIESTTPPQVPEWIPSEP